MNYCRETVKMGVPPGNRPAVSRDWLRGLPERHVAGADTRGRQEGRPYPWSQQVIHKISGLAFITSKSLRLKAALTEHSMRFGNLVVSVSFAQAVPKFQLNCKKINMLNDRTRR